MKVSVVVPAYNEENYIGKCLDSLMAQIEKPDEIIVVNNNSTDNTAKIVKQYPGVTIINEKKQGISYARNKGFNTAQYDIIARTDADTIVPPDWILRIKKVFRHKANLVGYSGPTHFYDAPAAVEALNVPTYMFLDRIYWMFVRHDFLFGPNLIVRKKVWERIKDDLCMENDEVHEDMDLSIHLAKEGKIKFDLSFSVYSSCRRLKDYTAYYDYPLRSIKTLQRHAKRSRLSKHPRTKSSTFPKWVTELMN